MSTWLATENPTSNNKENQVRMEQPFQIARNEKDFTFSHPINPFLSILPTPSPGPFKKFLMPIYGQLVIWSA